MSECLVLNRNFYAVHIASWQKVMCLLYKGHAKAIDKDFNTYDFDSWKDLSQGMKDYPNGFKQAVNFKIAIPDVIILTFYDKLPKMDVRFTRRNIFKHYNYKCCYCGSRFNTEELNLDHVVPRGQRGTTAWNNVVLSCVPCNMKKGNRTPKEAKMLMKYKPSKPRWQPSYAVKINTGIKIRESWKKFIDEVYWNSELKNEN